MSLVYRRAWWQTLWLTECLTNSKKDCVVVVACLVWLVAEWLPGCWVVGWLAECTADWSMAAKQYMWKPDGWECVSDDWLHGKVSSIKPEWHTVYLNSWLPARVECFLLDWRCCHASLYLLAVIEYLFLLIFRAVLFGSLCPFFIFIF